MSEPDRAEAAREIRVATAADLAALPAIEEAADALFTTGLGVRFAGDTPSGAQRASAPGFVLAVAETPGGAAVGFAHVLTHERFAHLEQLSVHPDAGRRGHGRALVAAVIAVAAQRGCETVTLCTFGHLPWNQPFYESSGFACVPPFEDPFHREVLAAERAAELHHFGPRVFMAIACRPALP